MHDDEAIGVARVISPLQRKMLLDLDRWEPGDATDWNRDELVWKLLIEPSAGEPCGFRLTKRGVEVKNALELIALNDPDLIAALRAARPDSRQARRIQREADRRQLPV